jgi:protein-S-isoprenylcysteine O-methyltransferase Ste14
MTKPMPQMTKPSALSEIIVKVFISVLFTLFAYTSFITWREQGSIQMLLLAIQESIIVVLVVTRRRSREINTAWWDRFIAIAGTAAPLLQRPAEVLSPLLQQIGVTIQIASVIMSTIALLSIGRSFGIVAANRGVRTGGLYRFVRHPIYGSYVIGYIGFLLGNPSILNVLLIAVTFACQYLRAVAEERVLARDPEYQAYMQRVRYRFIPFIF